MGEGYTTVAEMAEKWGLKVRTVQIMCRDGKIEGAFKFGRDWAIPADAKKPVDKRVKTKKMKCMTVVVMLSIFMSACGNNTADIEACEESSNYRIEEYGIVEYGYVVPDTYTVCPRVAINVYKGKEGGFTMYGMNDRPSDADRSPANFRLVDVIWTHLAKYDMVVDGSSWEYQYDFDKVIFDKLPTMYPVEEDWVFDKYKEPGDCYIFQRETNDFTDSYRLHCVANNPVNVEGTDMYANFVYDFEEGYSTYNGKTSNYSGAPGRISVELGFGVTFSKLE